MKSMRFIILLAVSISLASCSTQPSQDQAGGEAYTCPMHPEVLQPGPGKCPVCGMDLVKKAAPASTPGALMLSDTQVRLANISTRPVARQEIGRPLALNARLAVDEERSEVVSTRAGGRVDRLFVKESGRLLRAGEPFLELYSESLLTLQQEYLLALEQERQLGGKSDRYREFVRSARKKLLLYGLTEPQVEELKRTSKVSGRITFVAPAGGIVTSVSVTEGQYVEEGAPLYRIEDIGRLWVESELYPDEVNSLGIGDRVTVKIAGFEEEPREALVTFVTPEYRDNSQVALMRAVMNNPKQIYKPGMAAQVFVRHSERSALAVPVDAVIRSAHGDHVFVETDRNTFVRRRVVTGLEDIDRVEITTGLKEGERIVVTGAYLLHSEMVLKGSAMDTGHSH